jgi:hypothetical protein
MAEWLLLLLLVPAIVVPVVLLVGFAGCVFEHGTSPFETTFSATGAFTGDGSGWEGYTLVQRIEPAGLNPATGPFVQVKITLFASTVMDASIDRIFISGPASTKDWDPGNDLTQVPLPNTPFVVSAGTSVTLDPVSYQVRPPSSDGTDPGRALLIAVDFSVPLPHRASGPRTKCRLTGRSRGGSSIFAPHPGRRSPPKRRSRLDPPVTRRARTFISSVRSRSYSSWPMFLPATTRQSCRSRSGRSTDCSARCIINPAMRSKVAWPPPTPDSAPQIIDSRPASQFWDELPKLHGGVRICAN